MNKFLLLGSFAAAVTVSILMYPQGAVAVVLCVLLSVAIILTIEYVIDEGRSFLKNLFLIALLIRLALGLFIYSFELQDFFGPDFLTYDTNGMRLSGYWSGELAIESFGVERVLSMTEPGWGMNYLVGIIYYIFGQSPLAVQFINATLGAGAVPAIYYCAKKIFNNLKVARYSAIAVAFFPSMILWSSQLLKDGMIIFFLAIAMACVVRLHEKFDYLAITGLVVSLFCIISFRFYIFYLVVTAVVGSFIVGAGSTSKAIGNRLAILLIIGIGMTYIGGTGSSTETLGRYADLERLQASREWSAKVSESGFAEDIDVSTTEGMVTILPIGIVYILFAPFPWQMTNFRSLSTLPDMILWWACIPFLITGLWYTIKHRLRGSIAILTFTVMLTVAYAIFQGNIGTAYRQRTQIQVFFVMFAAVGWTLREEKKENRELSRRHLDRQLTAHKRRITA